MGDDRTVVIGGGVIGLCVAYELARRGRSVVVVEADRVGEGASWGNAGWISPALAGPVPAPGVIIQGLRWMLHPGSPFYVKPRLSAQHWRFLIALAWFCRGRPYAQGLRANLALMANAFELLDEYRSNGVLFEEHRNGLPMLFNDAHNLHKQVMALSSLPDSMAAPIRVSAGEAAELEPAISAPLAGALVLADQRSIRPDQFTDSLARRVDELGGEIIQDTPVTGFRTDRGRVTGVRTPRETLVASDVVIATGAHAAKLTGKLQRRIPVQPGKGYSFDCAPGERLLQRMLYLYEDRIAVTPLAGYVRVAGCMEFAGFDDSVPPQRIVPILDRTRAALKDWPPLNASIRPWAGHRPMTPDGLPIIDRLAPWENAYVTTGHAMLGLTAAPASAKALVDLMVTGRRSAVLHAFRSGRFRW